MDTTQPLTPSQQIPQQVPAKGKKNKLSTIFLFIGVAIIVAAFTFGVMFFYMKSQQKVSFAPPFPKLSPMPESIEVEGTPSATPTSSSTTPTSGAAGPTAKLTPTTTATPSATPAP